MTNRIATCCCGQLRLRCDGDPVRVSICHCPSCQRRTGSVLGVQARYPEAATHLEGRASQWVRQVDDGDEVMFHFCPVCASTVFWQVKSLTGFTSVAVGAFGDPQFPPPKVSVWEATEHAWVSLPETIEHFD